MHLGLWQYACPIGQQKLRADGEFYWHRVTLCIPYVPKRYVQSSHPTLKSEIGNTKQQTNSSLGLRLANSSIIYARPVDDLRMLCYCTSSRTSFLFLRPNPHRQMNSGTGPSSPATQGCSAADCSVMRSPGSANQAHGRRGQGHCVNRGHLAQLSKLQVIRIIGWESDQKGTFAEKPLEQISKLGVHVSRYLHRIIGNLFCSNHSSEFNAEW
jgi:hypothetical protein